MKDGRAPRAMVIVEISLRIAVLVELFVFYEIGGLVPDDYWQVLYMLLPLTFFYLTHACMFTINNKYLLKRKKNSGSVHTLGFVFLIAVYLTEIALIAGKAVHNTFNSSTLYGWIGGAESLLGIHAGLYLVYLFAYPNNDLNDNLTI